MALYPNVRNDDIDDFEGRIEAFLVSASVTSLLAAVTAACKFIENESENAGLDMTHVNNATSTACHVAVTLSDRLAGASARIKELEAQLAEMVLDKGLAEADAQEQADRDAF